MVGLRALFTADTERVLVNVLSLYNQSGCPQNGGYPRLCFAVVVYGWTKAAFSKTVPARKHVVYLTNAPWVKCWHLETKRKENERNLFFLLLFVLFLLFFFSFFSGGRPLGTNARPLPDIMGAFFGDRPFKVSRMKTTMFCTPT